MFHLIVNIDGGDDAYIDHPMRTERAKVPGYDAIT